MEDISKEVQEQLEAIKRRTTESDIEIDFEELERELSAIGFDVSLAPEEFGIETVEFMGAQRKVYRFNNFPTVFRIYDAQRRGKKPENPLEEAYSSVAQERDYEQIFQSLEEQYPELYRMMRYIATQYKMEADSSQSFPEGKIYASAAYGAMAKFAKQNIDPNYDLSYLYK